MNGFRRRLMLVKKDESYEVLVERFTNTTETQITIPSNAVAMDIFLVGGGGGGGSWKTWGYQGGSPGLGGECYCKRQIPLYGVTNISYKCGNGGSKATNTTAGIISAKSGGDTTITVGNETFSAIGGVAGLNSISNSNLTQITYPDGTTSHNGAYIQKCSNQKGHDNRILTNNGLEGGYMKGLLRLDYSYWLDHNGYWQDSESIALSELLENIEYPNYYDNYIYGIPEFFEEGGYTYGAQGVFVRNTRNATTYGEQGEIINNKSYLFVIGQACGYGGGGFGGTYTGEILMYGGNGTQGIVVVRWYLKR